MKQKRVLILIALTLSWAAPGFSQSPAAPKRERHIGRIVGTAGGAFLGLLVGYVVSDDDAVNSTEKLVRNIAIGSAAGAVGGYFLGRTVDRRISQDRRRDAHEILRAQARGVETTVRALAPLLALDSNGTPVNEGERGGPHRELTPP